jgi:glycogenin glucosyltransferase
MVGADGSKDAYVTMVTSDSYVIGALVLGHSLIRTKTTKGLVCLVGIDVSDHNIDKLSKVFQIVRVKTLDSQDTDHLKLLGRPELGVTFTKLYVWSLTFLTKAVFLDADTLVLANVDDLFEREEFSACADVGWPDCFNSGVFVCKPNKQTFHDLVHLAANQGSFDGNCGIKT